MGIVQGTFIYKGSPTNAATAKLWGASVFDPPPEYDDDEPGSGQVGEAVTTGVDYGGDGAYRWVDVDDGAYYVSIEYDNHRVFQYHHVEDIASILTTEGDILVMGGEELERLPIDDEGKILAIYDGVPAWRPLPWVFSTTLLRHSDDAVKSTSSTTYVKIKEFKLNEGFWGTIRTKFDLRSTGGEYRAWGKIYRNGVALGVEKESSSDSFVTWTEDLNAEWVANDLIQIYAKREVSGTAEVQNFRLYFEVTYTAPTNQDP